MSEFAQAARSSAGRWKGWGLRKALGALCLVWKERESLRNLVWAELERFSPPCPSVKSLLCWQQDFFQCALFLKYLFPSNPLEQCLLLGQLPWNGICRQGRDQAALEHCCPFTCVLSSPPAMLLLLPAILWSPGDYSNSPLLAACPNHTGGDWLGYTAVKKMSPT